MGRERGHALQAAEVSVEEGRRGLSSARGRREERKGGGEKKMEKEKENGKKGKEKKKKKEKEGERKREIRGEPFGGDHDEGRARAAVAAACRGFGGKWRAWIEGNKGTVWRLDSGVGTG